jgi:hypothetical protein
MRMKLYNDNNISEKFWNGETSISEENDLFENAEGIEIRYIDFISEKRNAPLNLENEIWNTIELKKKRRIRDYSFASVAASVLVLVGVFGILNYQERQRELEMQFALIEQTLQHAANEVSVEEDALETVLYEDELITIVAEN